ncbi:volume-regulated anion channel subunit LRRC8C-like isoform X1 [Ranitomeya variabilis]|uniref:volume-regulated anion channel subunit LRRC8C-like isoform X1 n=1 Tax=Ranitomeya variabilis TaxID=490064 RepID=UPI004055E147
MFLVAELMQFTAQDPSLRIVKPWWDVMCDYLNLLMLLVSVFFATLQAYSENVLCVPVPPKPLLENVINLTSIHGFPSYYFTSGHMTIMESQYYLIINQWCYEHVVPNYARFFPYLILVNSTVFMVTSNFWFKFPVTLSRIKHFITVLGMCLDSSWTTKALAKTMYEESRIHVVPSKTRSEAPEPISPSVSHIKNIEQPLITEQSEHSLTPPQKQVSFSLEEAGRPSVTNRMSKRLTKAVTDKRTNVSIVDKKEGEQAKALFERVKNFRLHTEGKSLLYYTYKAQAILRVLLATALFSYVTYHTHDIKFEFYCVEPQNISGYTEFNCIYVPWRMFNLLSIIFLLLLFVYILMCLYTMYWIFCYKLREYSFEIIRNGSSIDGIPVAMNDFAFLLHLIDQYNPLYVCDFAVFLSDVSETKLNQINMNINCTQEKLKQCLSINSEGKTEMRLPIVPGFPEQLFHLKEIEVLKVEKIKSATLTGDVSNLWLLKELWITNCNIKVRTRALNFLKKNLRILRVNFSNPDEIPSWMYNLSSLRELYISGQVQSERRTIVALQSFKELTKLKFLFLKLHTSSIPSAIICLAQTLESLTIHNDYVKLSSVSIFKKFTNLKQLTLNFCQLDHIPSSIFNLAKLQEVDFTNNNLSFLDELASLQQLENLVSLHLSRNNISSIPPHIAKVSSLKKLYINNNHLKSISSAIFKLTRLTYLNFSNNHIHVLPAEIGNLVDLQYLSISHNKLAVLPSQLFSCKKLQTLVLSHNKISIISSYIGELTQLTYLDLMENNLEKLPPELENCTYLKRNQLLVEEEVFDTLPYEIRERMNIKNYFTSELITSSED